jgi:hypothetical protein
VGSIYVGHGWLILNGVQKDAQQVADGYMVGPHHDGLPFLGPDLGRDVQHVLNVDLFKIKSTDRSENVGGAATWRSYESKIIYK